MPFVVGLTGGIGSGKTAASDYLKTKGVVVVDADVVAREVVEPGTSGLAAIVEHFGDGVLNSEGSLDRAALRQQVFAAPEQRQWLEALLHPLIRTRILQQIQQAHSDYVVLASPLLFETDQHKLVHRTLLVDVPEALQIERTMARDANSQAQVEAIMAAQATRQSRLDQADDVVSNEGDLKALHAQLAPLHQRYLEYAKQTP